MNKVSANIQRRFDMEHRILSKLAKRMPVGVDQVGMAYPQVAADIDEPVHAVLAAKKTMEDAGILKTRIEYPKGKSGRVGVWTLAMDEALAHEEMTKEHQRQLARPSSATLRKRQKATEQGESILRYVSGEDNELKPFEPIRALRKDEALALVEAARQYRSRADVVESKVKELEAAGVEVAPEAFALRRDERLEHIALVVPAVDELVRERDRFEEQASRWAGRISEVQKERDEFKRLYEGAKRALDERIRKDVAHSQSAGA